jgi:hypothetical protein
VHTACRRSNERVAHLPASFIGTKHVEKHVNRFLRHRDKLQNGVESILRLMNQVQVMARNLKVRSGEPGLA